MVYICIHIFNLYKILKKKIRMEDLPFNIQLADRLNAPNVTELKF